MGKHDQINRPAKVPGITYLDNLRKLNVCNRSAPLLAAAIEQSDWRQMSALDYKRWDSVHAARRWSRNDDDIKGLLDSGEDLDIYWTRYCDAPGNLYWTCPSKSRTEWRIVRRKRVDGYIQMVVFHSVGRDELEAVVEATVLRAASGCATATPTDPLGRPRL